MKMCKAEVLPDGSTRCEGCKKEMVFGVRPLVQKECKQPAKKKIVVGKVSMIRDEDLNF